MASLLNQLKEQKVGTALIRLRDVLTDVTACSRPYLALLCLLLVAGCGTRETAEPRSVSVQTSDSAGVALVHIAGEVTDLPVWTIPEIPAFEVRGDVSPFIGSVGQAALLSDGRLLIEDDQTKHLYLFDRSGGHIVLANPGDGPGEFRDVTAFSVLPGDTVYAFDRRHLRVSVFDSNADLVRTAPVDPNLTADGTLRRAWALGPDQFLAQTAGPLGVTDAPDMVKRDQRDAVVHALDGAGYPRGSSVRFQGGYTIRGILKGQGIIIVAPFANVPIVAPGRGYAIHSTGLEYELIVTDPELQPRQIIRWPGWIRPVSDSLLQTSREQAEGRFADLRESNPESAALVIEAMFSEELLPEFLPALREVLIDDTGKIWVSKFRPSTDPWNQRTAWHVLAVDGTPIAQVVLPDRTRLVDVRGDEVVLIAIDELDVEHVRILSLDR